MSVTSREQDFADRHYMWFGGRKHFGFLTKMAQKYGVWACDRLVSEMKHDQEEPIPEDVRIKWFTKVIQKP